MFPMFQVPNEAEGIIRTHVKSYAIVHDQLQVFSYEYLPKETTDVIRPLLFGISSQTKEPPR